MPKFTYPIVFVFNETEAIYNGFIPDLVIFADGEKLEDVYARAEDLIYKYFLLATHHDIEFPPPSSLEEITKKWEGYKVSLITANLPN